MRKFLMFFATMMAVASLSAQEGRVRAQRNFDPEMVATMQTQRLNEAVGLDSLQYQLVYIMNYSDAVATQDSIKARRARAEEARKSGQKMERQRPTEEQIKARREIMEQRKAVRNAQMKEILSAEQYEKYLKYMAEQEKQSRQRWQGRGGRSGRGGERR